MKTYIFTLGLILIASTSFSQHNKKNIKHHKVAQLYKIDYNKKVKRQALPLNQTLYIIGNNNNSATLSRRSTNKFGYGSKMRLNSDGTMSESYTAPCGNDRNIHRNVGVWSAKRLQNGNFHLKTSIPIKNYGRNLILIKDGPNFIIKPKKRFNKRTNASRRIVKQHYRVQRHL